MKNYRIIGWVKNKGQQEWQQFNEGAVMPCPDNTNPYLYITNGWENVLDHWIVYFDEIKEE